MSKNDRSFYAVGMPRITETRRLARRGEVLNAAIELFARKGFDATSMADIVAESGTSAGMIYGHFDGKADLVRSAVGELFAQRSDEFDAHLASGATLSPSELVGAFLGRMRVDLDRPEMLLQLWAAAVREPELHEIAGSLGDELTSVFERQLTVWYRSQGLAEDAAAARAAAESAVCLGICQGYMIQSALFPDFDGDAYLDAVRTLLG